MQKHPSRNNATDKRIKFGAALFGVYHLIISQFPLHKFTQRKAESNHRRVGFGIGTVVHTILGSMASANCQLMQCVTNVGLYSFDGLIVVFFAQH